MLKQHSKTFSRLFFLADLTVIAVSWFLVYAIILKNPFISNTTITSTPFLICLIYLVPVLAISAVTMRAFGIYRPRRMGSIRKELIEVLAAYFFIMLFLTAATLFLGSYAPSMAQIAIFSFTSLLLQSLQRMALRKALRSVRSRGYNLRRILIAGTGDAARDVAELLLAHPEFGIRIVGFMSDDSTKIGSDFMGYPVICLYTDTNNILAKRYIDQVIVTLDTKEKSELPALLKALTDNTLDVMVVTKSGELTKIDGVAESFYGFPVIAIPGSPLYGWRTLLKRIADIFFSTIALFLTAPFMVVVALLIKLTSPGPVFYKQERTSVRGRSFQMLKFRSMTVGAEDKSGPIWAKENDKRRTWIGAFLRKKSLDELPQLFNVLKGEMSLVGPRPERKVFIDEFKKKMPKYIQRHKIKSGITGWAQANDLRGKSDMDKRLDYDLYYIRNWSFLFDIKIMWLTLLRVFFHKNAY